MDTLFDYFDRISIIHLPERTDRLASLTLELSNVGLEITSSKISIPNAPRPQVPNGFPSRGVYGNFLSHIGIIEQAYTDNLEAVLVLEDDAIFSRSFKSRQETLATHLRDNRWDIAFFGHSIERSLPKTASGLARFSGTFLWSHCYGVHRRVMPRLIEYFRQTMERESGHPDGGKMYIDGAHNEFRRLNPDMVCLVSAPCLSVQRGSPSGLNDPKWHDGNAGLRWAIESIRGLRDEMWRRGFITIGPPKSSLHLTKIDRATEWP
jgi:hypothetical protein